MTNIAVDKLRSLGSLPNSTPAHRELFEALADSFEAKDGLVNALKEKITAQEARIAELEAQTDAEPIYQWKSPFTHGNWVEITKRDYELVSKTDACTGENPITFTRKLYTHPPKQANQWQPIETAPATPAAILLLTTSGKMKIETGHWARNMVAASKVDGDDCFYTHWMPLPEPPIFNGVKP